MSATAAQVSFAAEFVTFLVAAGGLALVVLSSDLASDAWWSKLYLAVGFGAMGVAAFGHGSSLVKDSTGPLVTGLRLTGLAGLAAGSFHWRGGRPSTRLLWLGVVLTASSVAAGLSQSPRVAEGLLAGGSVVLGIALLAASRRSISARVAASAAGTLLLVVLVLSVALSTVLSSSAQQEELTRLSSRGRTEAGLATDSFVQEVQTARFVGEYLEKSAPAALVGLARSGGPLPADHQSVVALLTPLQALYPVGGLAYLLPTGEALASTGFDPGLVAVLTRTDLVRQATCPGPLDRGSAVVVGGQAMAVAAYPECLNSQRLGVVLRVSPLNGTYLAGRRADDSTVSLTIADSNGVLAEIGDQPSGSELTLLARAVVATNSPSSRLKGAWYVAAVPIEASDRKAVAALVASAPTSVVAATRDRLFRTLFLIALGGTLLALGLAALVGDRITAGLRRLTLAAQSIQRGDTSQRAAIAGADEVGVLGAAFDSMADSIEEKNSALQGAADDETRLRNRLEAVIAGMGDALVAVDRDGRITDFNQAAEELTGVAATSAHGRPADDVLDLVGEDGISLGFRLRTPSATRWGVLATLVPASGDPVPIAVSGGALRGPGNDVVGSVLVLSDLRREREVERMKSEFLSRVGHELRTPLTGIMGYADILVRRHVEPARARLWYGEILVGAKRLLRIVEMLEFFASSGAGRGLLRPERIKLRGLVDDVVTNWADRLPPSHTITRRVDRDTPDVLGDPRWLSLAVDELIDNAVKFSPDGGRITVSLSAGSSGNSERNGRVDSVAISVRDNGMGMTSEAQASAFGEFVQGDASDTRRFGGLGLGLSLVQRVVEGHGGRVSCVSAPSEGSTFSLTLPTAQAGPSGPEEKPAEWPGLGMQR